MMMVMMMMMMMMPMMIMMMMLMMLMIMMMMLMMIIQSVWFTGPIYSRAHDLYSKFIYIPDSVVSVESFNPYTVYRPKYSLYSMD